MDQRNYDLLSELDPKSLRKVVWLGALDGKGIEIEDPYGKSKERMGEVIQRMDACLDRLSQGASLASSQDSRGFKKPKPYVDTTSSAEEIAEGVLKRLAEAVRMRLMSDVV